MALVARAMEAFGLRAQLTRIVANLDRGRRHDTARMLEQLVALRLVGGEALSDLRRLHEPALTALFDWEAVAHGGTFSGRLKDFTWRHNLGLQQVVRDLYRRLAPSGPRLWAIDSTVEPVFGVPEGAAGGYNPHIGKRTRADPFAARKSADAKFGLRSS